jgi:hypothetical protein
LPIPLGNRHELVVELGVDLGGELLGGRGWHGSRFPVRLLSYLLIMIKQDKSVFIHIVVNKRFAGQSNECPTSSCLSYNLAVVRQFQCERQVLGRGQDQCQMNRNRND